MHGRRIASRRRAERVDGGDDFASFVPWLRAQDLVFQTADLDLLDRIICGDFDRFNEMQPDAK